MKIISELYKYIVRDDNSVTRLPKWKFKVELFKINWLTVGYGLKTVEVFDNFYNPECWHDQLLDFTFL